MDIRLVGLALGAFAIGIEGFVVASLLPQIAGDTGVTLGAGRLSRRHLRLRLRNTDAPVAAALTGSLDRRTVLTGSTLVFVAGALACRRLAHLSSCSMAARLLIAVVAGLYAATAQATAVAISEPHHRARAIAAIVGGTTLAVAFGATAWRLHQRLCWMAGDLSCSSRSSVALAALAVWFVLPRGLYADRLTIAQRLGVVRHPGLLPALLTMLLYMTGPFAVYTYIAAVAVDGSGAQPLPDCRVVPARLRHRCGDRQCPWRPASPTALAQREPSFMASVLNAVVLMSVSWIMTLPNDVAGPTPHCDHGRSGASSPGCSRRPRRAAFSPSPRKARRLLFRSTTRRSTSVWRSAR